MRNVAQGRAFQEIRNGDVVAMPRLNNSRVTKYIACIHVAAGGQQKPHRQQPTLQREHAEGKENQPEEKEKEKENKIMRITPQRLQPSTACACHNQHRFKQSV
jgi:hypothetical protein